MTAGAHAPQHPSALVREPKTDAAAVVGRAKSLDQARALEAVDVPGQRRRGDPLLGGELCERQARAPLDEPEQGRLTGGDPELLRLLPELTGEPEENGAEVGGDCFP